METFNIHPTIINMTKTLYKDATSMIQNDGKNEIRFRLERSCRQGDALSPFLFIIALEPLLAMIRREERLPGIDTGVGRFKNSTFADDLNGIFNNKEEIDRMARILDRFKIISGLKCNKNKCEIMPIGEWDEAELQSMPYQIKKQVKITGVHFGTKEQRAETEKLNFDPIITKIKRLLGDWKSRDVSLAGKVLLIKTFAISQIRYQLASIAVPLKYIKLLNKIIYNFLWRGPDRITRRIASREWKDGGVKLSMVEDIIQAEQIKWLSKARATPHRIWAKMINKDLTQVGGRAGLDNKLTKQKVNKTTMLDYTKVILNTWIEVKKGNNELNTGGKLIWEGKGRLRDKKGKIIKSNILTKWGFNRIGDFFDDFGN